MLVGGTLLTVWVVLFNGAPAILVPTWGDCAVWALKLDALITGVDAGPIPMPDDVFLGCLGFLCFLEEGVMFVIVVPEGVFILLPGVPALDLLGFREAIEFEEETGLPFGNCCGWDCDCCCCCCCS